MKKEVASWIAAGVFALGGGAAFAAEGAEEPAAPADEQVDEGAAVPEILDGPEDGGDDDGVAVPVDEATEYPPTDDADEEAVADAPDGEVEEEKKLKARPAHPENHGKLVSEAAHDRSNDEACGNHGKAVSAVARGVTCAGMLGEPAEEEAEAGDDQASDAEAPSAEGKDKDKGKAKG